TPEDLAHTARPTYVDAVHFFPLSSSEMHTEQARRCVPYGSRHVISLIPDFDDRSNTVTIALRAPQLQDQPRIASGAGVLPDFRLISQRRRDYIDSPVSIKIRKGRTAMSAHGRDKTWTGALRRIIEPSPTQVPEHAVVLPVLSCLKHFDAI